MGGKGGNGGGNSSGFGSETEHIQLFAKNLSRAKAVYGEPATAAERYRKQKHQVETLVALESEFRRALIAHRWGPGVYRQFVTFICDDRRNILAARPYFRERQTVFTRDISKVLKRRQEKGLYRFHFNFQFVLFAMRARPWKHGSLVSKLYRRIAALRQELVETNMPLALNRARIFFSKTPTSHLTYMDLVQIASEGLMSGIDKFCLPFSATFRGVAIGRMVGNFIENYSATLLHYYPPDKRKIYRANKFAGKHQHGIDYERLAEEVNVDAKDPVYRTNPEEIAALMAAASTVSADSGTVPGFRGDASGGDAVAVPKLVDRFAAPEDTRPDVRVETQEALGAMHAAIGVALPLRDRKFLAMRGICPESLAAAA